MLIDVGDVLSVTESFVITHGTNPRQVRAIVESIEEDLEAAGGPAPIRVEGAETREWVLLDYGDFVVHVFDVEARDFYQLERLWGDCARVAWRVAEVAGSAAEPARPGAPADDRHL
ncbi:MAG: ribosome silencing factor, partial [Acidimicrobiales bacterium]